MTLWQFGHLLQKLLCCFGNAQHSQDDFCEGERVPETVELDVIRFLGSVLTTGVVCADCSESFACKGLTP
jgi:hypothetical protein